MVSGLHFKTITVTAIIDAKLNGIKIEVTGQAKEIIK